MKQISKIKVLIIDPEKGITEKVIDNNLRSFYREINCNYIDISSWSITGQDYDFIIDDEGLLKPNPMVSVISLNNKPIFFGRIILTRNCEGLQTSLTDKDIKKIKKHLENYFNYKVIQVDQLIF
ncbi:hypothetical protein JF73_17540 (plasmid) [Lactobacillus helsingborgensis]|uniref:DUF3846 domain-containing protein n=2 Tax=Lactobacillus TaxID=1578 RepID=A0AA47GHW0_9LACO|nr:MULTISPECIES: hypothetical protein [Lactobacillus]KJY54740.1 DUF3846 protein [Lactobacillus melliventris]KJY60577.1 hypothetical protein JF73_17540 [Lactobacillus helsingborgensis]UZX30623.1 hypothetical protein LDX53_09050 [Lactobacillus helsingborgensis]